MSDRSHRTRPHRALTNAYPAIHHELIQRISEIRARLDGLFSLASPSQYDLSIDPYALKHIPKLTLMSRSFTLKSRFPTINFVFPPTAILAFPFTPLRALSIAIAVAAFERIGFLFFPPFFTPPPMSMAIGVAPVDRFFSPPIFFLPPIGVLFPVFFAFALRALGVALRVSLIIASRDWSSMAAMGTVDDGGTGSAEARDRQI